MAAPKHLTTKSRNWFDAIVKGYNLESHHLSLLQAAAECWDRSQEAREILAKEGIVFKDRHGAIRPHPATQIERDNKALFARLVRELALDVSEPDDSRPPKIVGKSSLKLGGA